jgi:chemotaxis protein MotB
MSSRAKYVEDDGPRVPDWIVTFSDMVSLLVTFFILLMTFSSMNVLDAFQSEGRLTGQTGQVHNEMGESAPDPLENDFIAAMNVVRGGTVPHSRPPEELPKNIEAMGMALTDDHVEIDFARSPDGLIIRFDEGCLFAPGSATVPRALIQCLTEIGAVLEHYENLVVIEGFTDAGFVPTTEFQSSDALAHARAFSTAELLLKESALSPALVQISGIGSRRFAEGNDTALDRKRNRRVEIRVLSLSRARQQAVEASK